MRRCVPFQLSDSRRVVTPRLPLGVQQHQRIGTSEPPPFPRVPYRSYFPATGSGRNSIPQKERQNEVSRSGCAFDDRRSAFDAQQIMVAIVEKLKAEETMIADVAAVTK